MGSDRALRSFPGFEPLWQKLTALPVPETEDSLLFRILVQLLVIVGIAATDAAAGTQMSLWAIPLSVAGASWSWYRRQRRNVAVKFLLALGMLVVLFVFLGKLLAHLNDTRLVLAELLVQLQVLHSFDLPRRKDLGYSMAIGLILLGVAGTLSQTLAFAPWLVAFLALALPVLVLDYRSRLGLARVEGVLQSGLASSPLSPWRLALLLALTSVLGLGIFALMPRFPGYQLQSFPVSTPAGTEQQFGPQNRDIVNPGYVRAGQEGQGSGRGGSSLEGSGAFDPTAYYGFNSKIDQKLGGVMEPKVVLRIRSQAPGFWRVLAFDRYTGQGWEISRNDDLAILERPSWSYRFELPPPLARGRKKQVIQTYTAVSDLPNILPTLSHAKSIFFPAREIGLDAERSLRSPSGLVEGLTYTVISEVPYRDRTALRELSQPYPQPIREHYLSVPPAIAGRVRARAEELLSKSPQPITSAYEKALFLAQALKQNYRLPPEVEVPPLQPGEDLVEAFLFRHGGGYPDRFATVLTVMLRSLGIPARLSVGFAPGQFNPFTGYYIVRNTDAHALTEVYFPGFGWYSFDPIPGHPLIPPSFEEETTFSVLKQFWNWVAGWLPSPLVSFFSLLWSKIAQGFLTAIAGVWRFLAGSFLGATIGLISAVALAFLGWLGWTQVRRFLQRRRWAKLPPMARTYQQMLASLTDRGYPKLPAQTPLEYARELRQQQPPERAEIIEQICQAYVSWRYGGRGQNVRYWQGQLKRLIRSFNRLESPF